MVQEVLGAITAVGAIYLLVENRRLLKELSSAESTAKLIMDDKAKVHEELGYREIEVDDLKTHLKDGGMMMKKEVVIKEVKIDFSQDEREALMIAMETTIVNGLPVWQAKFNLDLIEKMRKTFTEASEAEYDKTRRG